MFTSVLENAVGIVSSYILKINFLEDENTSVCLTYILI